MPVSGPHQREKFSSTGAVLLECAQQATGDHVSFPLADASAAHALMFTLHHHGDSFWLEHARQLAGNLPGQAFLYLESARKDIE